MGCYVNPPNESKEEFLKREGRVIRPEEAVIANGEYPVCLVNNGLFTAAGIGITRHEIDTFGNVSDGRLKVWFMVPLEKLKTVSDIEVYIKD